MYSAEDGYFFLPNPDFPPPDGLPPPDDLPVLPFAIMQLSGKPLDFRLPEMTPGRCHSVSAS